VINAVMAALVNREVWPLIFQVNRFSVYCSDISCARLLLQDTAFAQKYFY